MEDNKGYLAKVIVNDGSSWMNDELQAVHRGKVVEGAFKLNFKVAKYFKVGDTIQFESLNENPVPVSFISYDLNYCDIEGFCFIVTDVTRKFRTDYYPYELIIFCEYHSRC